MEGLGIMSDGFLVSLPKIPQVQPSHALSFIDLTTWTKAYTGAKWTGNGIGLSKPTPGLSTWKQNAAPPNGWTQSPVGAWAHGGYVYFVYNGTDGSGKGIYQFSVDADGNLTYSDFVSQAALGLVTGDWGRPPCFYDSADGSVILITYPKAGADNSPIAGKWLCGSAWPFTNANHEWQSGLAQSYGSYVAGKVTNEPRGYLGGTYLFIVSSNSGQVQTIDPSDGSVDGTWVYDPAYRITNQFKLTGENSSGQPIGGSYHVNGGNQSVYSWDISNLSAWATDTQLLVSSGVGIAITTPEYIRAKHLLHGARTTWAPVSKKEITALGLTGCMYWLNVRTYSQLSEPHLIHYEPDTDTYRECLTANGSTRRSIGNRSAVPGQDLGMFITINGIPWFISWNETHEDQEDEDPGGATSTHYGICLIAVGPGVVKFSKTVTADGTPKRIQPTIAAAAKNYLCSESYQKHEVRFKNVTKGGGFTPWRSGEQEMSALDQVVNGKAAWGSWDEGDALEIEWRLYAGWPQAVDGTVYQNPGEVGDPGQLPTSTADVGPPREVVPILTTVPIERGGGLL